MNVYYLHAWIFDVWMFTFCYVFVLMPGVFFVVGIFAGFFLLILKFIWHVMVLWEFLAGERKIGELERCHCLGLIKFHDWHWTRFTLTGLHLNI